MRELRVFNGEAWRSERGFTLPELLTTIAILGILIGIAISMWNSVMESRRVDAAANQLASDLRLAHTRATNQLTDWRVVLAPDRDERDAGADYYLVRLDEPYESGDSEDPAEAETIPRTLPHDVKVVNDSDLEDDHSADWWVEPEGSPDDPTRTIEFNSDGTLWSDGPSGTVQVEIDGGPTREMTYLSATSRIKLD